MMMVMEMSNSIIVTVSFLRVVALGIGDKDVYKPSSFPRFFLLFPTQSCSIEKLLKTHNKKLHALLCCLVRGLKSAEEYMAACPSGTLKITGI